MSPLFTVMFAYSVGERIGELFLSRRNRALMARRGFAQREPLSSLGFMAAMHTAWLISTLCEAALVPAQLPDWITLTAAGIFCATQLLRLWTLRTLGTHWNVSVMTDASSPRAFVSNGPYRFIRHPNYLVVILEIFSLPLLGGAIFSSLIFSAINAGVLFFRIRLEERHLRDVPGYWSVMGNKPRFVPLMLVRDTAQDPARHVG